MSQAIVFDEPSLRDFIVFVQFHAPNRFPIEDYLSPAEQMTFEKAFATLRDGLQHSRMLRRDPDQRLVAVSLVDEAYRHFSSGDARSGSGSLTELQKLLGYDLKSWIRKS